jgi:hypothetical protein
MERREVLKAGLCLFGGACLAAERGWAGSRDERHALPRVPRNLAVRTRTFEMKLAPICKRTLYSRLCWLESMLHRLGRDVTLALWSEAFRLPDDGLMTAILAGSWEAYEDRGDGVKRLDEMIGSRFSAPVEGISKVQAHDLAMMDAGVRLPGEKFPSLNVMRRITAYDALHLRLDGLARLAATMTSQLGKEGELLAYDFCRNDRLAAVASGGEKRTAAEALKSWADMTRSTEEGVFSAGLKAELIRESATEVMVNITECEWARYFRERHPTVGYLVACSTDDAALRATTDKLWLQRTSTIMEGGNLCDFRVFMA